MAIIIIITQINNELSSINSLHERKVRSQSRTS
jgi:hypothetical protein